MKQNNTSKQSEFVKMKYFDAFESKWSLNWLLQNFAIDRFAEMDIFPHD